MVDGGVTACGKHHLRCLIPDKTVTLHIQCEGTGHLLILCDDPDYTDLVPEGDLPLPGSLFQGIEYGLPRLITGETGSPEGLCTEVALIYGSFRSLVKRTAPAAELPDRLRCVPGHQPDSFGIVDKVPLPEGVCCMNLPSVIRIVCSQRGIDPTGCKFCMGIPLRPVGDQQGFDPPVISSRAVRRPAAPAPIINTSA